MRLLAIVNDYSGELLRIAPELRKYLPGEAYQQVDFGREADYIYRALSSFFLEIATLQPICLSFEDLQWADKSSLDLLAAPGRGPGRRARRSADGSTAAPRLVIVASARTGYAAARSPAGPAPRAAPRPGAAPGAADRGRDARADRPAAELPARGAVRRPGRSACTSSAAATRSSSPRRCASGSRRRRSPGARAAGC